MKIENYFGYFIMPCGYQGNSRLPRNKSNKRVQYKLLLGEEASYTSKKSGA